MKKLLILMLLLTFCIPVKANELDLTPNGKYTILMEASSGKVLYNKKGNERVAVASLTKMMSLILFFEHLEKGGMTIDEKIVVSENAKNMGGTQIFLETNEQISVKDLLKGVVMASANDAAVALAERVSGTEEAFVIEMNKKVKELGLKNTNFKNVTGLDENDHYSSAYDMALIAKELLTHEEILNFSSVYEDYIREDTANRTWVVNTNKLVRFYDGADGLKTGYTDNALSCIAATAKKDNLRLIAINLGYSSVTQRNTETMSLLDYGFNQYKADLLYSKGDVVTAIDLDKASINKVNLLAEEDVVIISKKTDPKIKYEYEVNLNNYKYPLKKNTSIGTLYIKTDNKVIKKTNLITEKDINKINIIKLYFSLFKDIITGE